MLPDSNGAVLSARKRELQTDFTLQKYNSLTYNVIQKYFLLDSGGLESQTCIAQFILAYNWIREERDRKTMSDYVICVCVCVWMERSGCV